jgi:hypothetical protein
VDAACAAGGACIDVEAALAFVDGEIADARRDEVERKIDTCARCRGVVAEAARDAVRTAREGPASQDQIAPGTMVGRYVVERAIGAGGMGVVSLARDPELRRAVVIKLVRPDFGEGRDDLEARLRREAQAMAQLSHPNVVQIFDLGRHGDRVFLAMEFVPGQTLDSWLIERARAIPEILAMFRQAGAGLDAAHRGGLVHRDFKPSNVLVTTEGVPKVTDFGLARSVAAPGASTSLPRASGIHSVLTQANAVMGTPAYMPPEQAAGLPVDERGDQYAFALALLDALLGQPPTGRRVRPGDPAIPGALADAGVDARARAAIVRALAAEPTARFPAMADLLRELAPPRRERRWPLVLALALAGGAIAVTVVLATRSTPAGCVAKAPARWAAGRGATVAKLAERDRPFASWAAKRTATAVDAAVARIGTDEVAQCQGRAVDTPCLTRRTAALDRVLAGDDAVHALERCDEPDPAIARELAALERELAEASAERARVIAARAKALADDRVLARALDRAGRASLGAGDIAGAERDFAELATAGNRAGDDVARGLAHLGLLEIASRRSSVAAATAHADALHALLGQYGATARDEVAIARVEATVFGDLGDARRALRAWDAARVAALQLGGDDALLVQIGRARARYTLQLDLAGARGEATAALATATASPAARAAAQVVLAELALAAGDARAAIAANADAKRIDPTRATVADLILDARGRAASGDLEVALASLPAARPPDQQEPDPNRASDAIRVAVGRATILHAAGRSADAREVLATALKPVISAVLERDSGAIAMTAGERAEALVLKCEIEILVDEFGLGCYEAQQALDKLHPKAPLRVRYLLAKVRDRREKPHAYVDRDLLDAIDILTVAGATPGSIAELHWDLARDPNVLPKDARAHAAAARLLYAGIGRTAEVAAIDRWLAGVDAGDAGVATDAASDDPWTTAP